MDPKLISINDFTYDLPESKIAWNPLPERDESKLLIWKDNNISGDIYKNIANYLPEKSLLIFNDTKVIQARIIFKKESGGIIEIFCLEPFGTNEYEIALNEKEHVQWKCMIGGASKWKAGSLVKKLNNKGNEIILTATLKQKLRYAYVTEFSWQPLHYTFAEIIEVAGDIPLPPYIKRTSIQEDKERYQTVYAKFYGSVAAPTAGLHFTPEIFSSLHDKNISTDFITLHVGAGTFKPVKSATMLDHEMHAEWIDVSSATIQNIINNPEKIIAVGTTSLRTLESLYWIGLRTLKNNDATFSDLEIKQWDVYDNTSLTKNIDKNISLQSLLKWMEKNNLKRLVLKTYILIVPGYTFKIVKALITNFHQPKSTLLLLVAAAIGDQWKVLYNYAIENNFRFLSYGDGCLIFIH